MIRGIAWRAAAAFTLLGGLVLVVLMLRPTMEPSAPSHRGEGDSGSSPVLVGAPPRASLAGTSPRPAEPPLSGHIGGDVEGERLRGQVVDTQDGSPIPSALVAAGRSALASGPNVHRTNEEGRFEIPLAKEERSGGAVLVVVREGYVPWRSPLEALPGSPDEIVVALERGQAIRGTVHDDRGRPLENAHVTAQVAGSGLVWPRAPKVLLMDAPTSGGAAHTDPAGRFAICGLVADSRYEIRATQEGYAALTGAPEVHGQVGEEVDCTLTALATFHLQVSDPHSQGPLSLGSVFARPGKGMRPYGRRPLLNRLEQVASAEVGGSYHLQFVRAMPASDTASVRVVASAPGYGAVRAEIFCPWGSSVTHSISLIPLAGATPRNVRFMATYAGGRPFSGNLLLQLRRVEDGPKPELPFPAGIGLRFDESGNSTHAHVLMSGTYTGSVSGVDNRGIWWRPAGPPPEFHVPTGLVDVRVPLVVHGTRVALKVVNEAGAVERGFGVEVRYPLENGGHRGGPFVREWDVPPTFADGTARTDEPPWLLVSPGPVEIEVRARSGAVGLATFTAGSTGDLLDLPVRVNARVK